jgi:hypothetical protein
MSDCIYIVSIHSPYTNGTLSDINYLGCPHLDATPEQ